MKRREKTANENREKEFREEMYRQAVDNRTLETEDYSPITLRYDNGRTAETDYIFEFGDDEILEVKFRTGHENNHFYFLESLSQGDHISEAIETAYERKNDIAEDLEGALDRGFLREDYTEPLSELLDEEVWD